MNLQRMKATLESLGRFGADGNGITRLAYTKPYREAVEYFIGLCKQAGLKVRIDTCGNVIARREGRDPRLPVVAIGSHLDTVTQGGAFDGTVGLVAGLEVIRCLNERGIETQHPIELIAFACEESARFGVSTVGSKAMAGLLKKREVQNLRDRNGVTMQEAFAECSLPFDRFDEAARKREEFKAFFELHIEQGPVLENEKLRVGIVTAIAAPTRYAVHIQGMAAHSGTTPMGYRKDALAGAAEIILALEEGAKAQAEYGTVATVGVCEVQPGAMNVIPGSVTLMIDIRGISNTSRSAVVQTLFDAMERLKKTRKLTFTVEKLSDEAPVHLDSGMVRFLCQTCERLKLPYRQMVSGAGHDAMNMARLCPTGLIFIPSKDGLSHHPDEFTSLEEIGEGTRLLLEAVLSWAGDFSVLPAK